MTDLWFPSTVGTMVRRVGHHFLILLIFLTFLVACDVGQCSPSI